MVRITHHVIQSPVAVYFTETKQTKHTHDIILGLLSNPRLMAYISNPLTTEQLFLRQSTSGTE